jgi:predicted ATPase
MQISPPLKKIVITGGPGAGKTALLELARKHFCNHIQVLPEAARIVFRGGFPRRSDSPGRRAAQQAIYHVQVALEALPPEPSDTEVILCDRGTLDGLAYWPGDADSYCRTLGTTIEAELLRYQMVIHLRTPHNGAYQNDAVRIESEAEADQIDRRLLEIWSEHPHRFIIDSTDQFLDKALHALEVIRRETRHVCR